MEEDIFEQRTDLQELQSAVDQLKSEIGKVIVGQETMIDLLLAALLADGHVLIEGVPGVAKTLTAKLLSKTLSVGFSRLQFTPDLMPSDVIGTPVFNPRDSEFHFRRGPVFSNIILIDEINRAPAKTQSALFEVMEERQVTVDGSTYPMELPFMVVATQNPVEQEGTYHLPEAQLDRFLFRINVGYPSAEQEFEILRKHNGMAPEQISASVERVLTAAMIFALREKVRAVHAEENMLHFITTIVSSTRNNRSIYLGASPRASIGILSASKAISAMRGRDFVTPEDIIFCAGPVLRHRIVLTPEKEMEGITPDDVIDQIIKNTEIPR